MSRRRACSIAVAVLALACTTASSSLQQIELVAVVEARAVGSETHPVATVTLTNRSDAPVAVSRTHCACHMWLMLEIANSSGGTVPYPADTPEFIVVEPPKHVCLGPDENLAWTIDLRDFQLQFGDEPRSKHL